MSTEQNKAVVRRAIIGLMNDHDLTVIDQLFAPDFDFSHDFPSSKPGQREFAELLKEYFNAFPDIRVTIEGAAADGDWVMTRGFFTATHKGTFQGISPTGKKIRVKYMDAWRLKNGKLSEYWDRTDMLDMLQQLGAIPRL